MQHHRQIMVIPFVATLLAPFSANVQPKLIIIIIVRSDASSALDRQLPVARH